MADIEVDTFDFLRLLVTYSELCRFDKMADVDVDAFILLLLTAKKDAVVV